MKSLILHSGAFDVVKQQSEVLKQDFIDLFGRYLGAVVFVSGPLPSVRSGDDRFSRLLMLNRWLKATCSTQSVDLTTPRGMSSSSDRRRLLLYTTPKPTQLLAPSNEPPPPLPLPGFHGWDEKACQCRNQTHTMSKSHILSPKSL